jgi:uncharacterized membrane protein
VDRGEERENRLLPLHFALGERIVPSIGVGAVIGTLGGYRARRGLVERTGGRDLPVALAEDVLAVGGGFVIVALAMNL